MIRVIWPEQSRWQPENHHFGFSIVVLDCSRRRTTNRMRR